MDNSKILYLPVWPEIAPWAVRITAEHPPQLTPPPVSKASWATEEVRKREEHYQNSMRERTRIWIKKGIKEQIWLEGGFTIQKVRILTDLSFLAVFRRLPENRRVLASALSADPIRLLTLVATSEDDTSKKEKDQTKPSV